MSIQLAEADRNSVQDSVEMSSSDVEHQLMRLVAPVIAFDGEF